MPRDQFNKPGQNRPATGKQQNDGCARVAIVPVLVLVAVVIALVM